LFGLSSFLVLPGIVLAVIGMILLFQQKHKIIAAICLIAGILLIFVPATLIFILVD